MSPTPEQLDQVARIVAEARVRRLRLASSAPAQSTAGGSLAPVADVVPLSRGAGSEPSVGRSGSTPEGDAA